jgi:hypothetical protein
MNIYLEDENHNRLERILDVHGFLIRAIWDKWDVIEADTCCLRFIDPYGYTVFNRPQMETFLSELVGLRVTTGSQELNQLLLQIEEFARFCAKEPHHYLVFDGD